MDKIKGGPETYIIGTTLVHREHLRNGGMREYLLMFDQVLELKFVIVGHASHL